MTFIPKCFYSKEITNLIDSYIDQGCSSYHDLDDYEKENISAECIRILGNDAYVCLIESDNISNVFDNLIKFMKTSDMDYGYELLRAITSNAVDHFSNYIQHIFSERLDEFNNIKKLEKGLKPMVNINNGETTWRKSL